MKIGQKEKGEDCPHKDENYRNCNVMSTAVNLVI